MNVQETEALALHSLAITLSDECRNPVREVTEQFIAKNCQQKSTNEILFNLTLAVREAAKRSHSDNPNDSTPIDTMSFLIGIVENARRKQQEE